MDSIIKQFVTFQQACDLVKLGFKEDCLSIFSEGELKCIEDSYCLGHYPFEFNDDPEDILIAPTYQQAFDFMYDKFKVVVLIHSSRRWSENLDLLLKEYKNRLCI